MRRPHYLLDGAVFHIYYSSKIYSGRADAGYNTWGVPWTCL
jgi:hypothetical protein